MSLHRAPLVALALVTLWTGLTFAPAPATAQYDFTCHPAREHCVAAARENYTIYVDTDGSMNASTGSNVCCGGGDDSYWEVVQNRIKNFADDNDNSGSCKTDEDPSKCDAGGCDGVRLGIGFFGDDSVSDPESDGLNAYQEETAGEGKRNQVKNAVDSESAGNVGLPGIETLNCPPDGPGQVDTITCPTMGSVQESRIACPPTGGFQIDAIGCPFQGTPQVDRIQCPADAVQQQVTFTVYSSGYPVTNQIVVDGEPFTFTNLTLTPTSTMAGVLYNQMILNGYMTSNYTMSLSGNQITITQMTPGVVIASSTAGYVNQFATPLDPTGLPNDPAVGTTYGFQVDGNNISYNSQSGDLSQDICAALAADVDALSFVTATSTAGVIEITSALPGDDFSVTNVSADLNYLGTSPFPPFLEGVPGKESPGYEWDFRVNTTKMAYNHTSADSAQDICQALVDEVNASGEPVTASLVNFGTNPQGQTDWRIEIAADVQGESFNLMNIDSNLRGPFVVSAGGPGLPGDPGDGYVFDFMLNSSLIQATGNPSSNTGSVCADLAASVTASGEPVVVTNFGSFIRIRPQYIGELFTIGSVDTELTHNPVFAGSPGLPGDPGISHVYSWDFTPFGGSATTINVPTPATVTTAGVCQAIATQLGAMPEFSTSLNLTQNQVTITPGIQGLRWDFTGMDPNLVHNSSPSTDLPFGPTPFNQYDFHLDGVEVTYTDDGTPTRAEICAGMTAAINSTVGGTVTATHNGSTITITGDTSTAFDITSVEGDLSPHIIVREAGLGPSAYGDLASRINSDLNITTRIQNAVVLTHRGPEEYADFSLAVDELCAKRDDVVAPAKTYFIGVDVSGTEDDLLDILAAAGGTGTCSGGIDPCVAANSTLVSSISMAPLVSCNGAYSVNEWDVDDALRWIKEPMSCSFELDVPPTYPAGNAPNNTDLTRVYINKWEGRCSDTIQVAYDRDYWPWDYWYDLDDCDGSSFANYYWNDGWQWVDSAERKFVTFDPEVCEEIQEGDIVELETHVGCLCANQGDECTAAFETVDPLTGIATPVPCKSPTHGRCDPDADGVGSNSDMATCIGGTATGECSDDGYCMQTCTAEQLAAMRCATGVYLCDEDTGTETCTAGTDNIVPEICNGVDDDCDGLIDNMSNNADDAFSGLDTQGRDCNGQDACICPDGWQDISSADPMDLQAHLDTWSGNCECGEALEAPEPEAAMSMETSEPEYVEPGAAGSTQAACAVAAGDSRSDLLLVGLLGLLALRRRRRRA